jgi:arylsulfatase A-like enzyme/sucrose-6-phosphate hydrolase SacC (GH32 family)
MICRILVLLLFLGTNAYWREASGTEPDPLDLSYHLMHPGGPSAPGDPNAAFCLDGTYHLHYILRHSWNGKRSFSFVHVTSPDLLHWTWQPTKLQPSFTGHGMFSGTGFITKQGEPAVIYHGQGSKPARNFISIARDRALSGWEKPYSVEVQAAPENMRHWDPDCFQIGETYYAISGGKNPPLFKSADLKNWTYVGPFFSHEPDDVVLGEDVSCPNFFRLGDKWMMLCISHPYGCRYYLGQWDAEEEQFVTELHCRMNWPQEGQGPHRQDSLMPGGLSRDVFAPESVLTSDGRRVMWAWLPTVDARMRELTIQSLPRELSLGKDGKLRIRPLSELESLRYDSRRQGPITIETEKRANGGIGSQRVAELDGDAFEIRVVVPRAQAMRKRFGLRLFASEERPGLPITVQPAAGTLRVGSTEAPFRVADLPAGEDVELRVFVDKYLVEVFANDRQAVVAADWEYRDGRGLDLFSWGEPTTFRSIEIHRLKPTNQGYHEAKRNQVWQVEEGTSSKNGTARGQKASVRPLADAAQAADVRGRPDVLFIAIDDMNDWTTLFDQENPIQTPNLKRLAARGAFFTHAYCASPGCNPSRTAIMTGLRPTTSGVYQNNHVWREALPDAVTLPQYFAQHGYLTRGGGKILHHGPSGHEPADNASFQEYFERVAYPNPKIRDGAFGCFDWGPVPADQMADTPMIEWAERELGEPHDRPLFLATGIFHPHLPHFAPPEIFEQYPFDQVVMPPMPPGDLDDVPPAGIEMARKEWNLWKGYLFDDPPPEEDPASLKSLVRAYQASSTYADEMVGRLIDRLDETQRTDKTIIVLWSDHGYHLGDKQSTVKFTLWEKANHVPLIIVAPGITKPGTRIDTPVSLVELYATLVDLAGLPTKSGLDSKSLRPLLQDPHAPWQPPAIMTMGRGNHAVRSEDWRYIYYADGSEELYQVATDDPWNHINLLNGDGSADYADIVAGHKKWLPANEAQEGPVYRRNRPDGTGSKAKVDSSLSNDGHE